MVTSKEHAVTRIIDKVIVIGEQSPILAKVGTPVFQQHADGRWEVYDVVDVLFADTETGAPVSNDEAAARCKAHDWPVNLNVYQGDRLIAVTDDHRPVEL